MHALAWAARVRVEDKDLNALARARMQELQAKQFFGAPKGSVTKAKAVIDYCKRVYGTDFQSAPGPEAAASAIRALMGTSEGAGPVKKGREAFTGRWQAGALKTVVSTMVDIISVPNSTGAIATLRAQKKQLRRLFASMGTMSLNRRATRDILRRFTALAPQPKPAKEQGRKKVKDGGGGH